MVTTEKKCTRGLKQRSLLLSNGMGSRKLLLLSGMPTLRQVTLSAIKALGCLDVLLQSDNRIGPAGGMKHV